MEPRSVQARGLAARSIATTWSRSWNAQPHSRRHRLDHGIVPGDRPWTGAWACGRPTGSVPRPSHQRHFGRHLQILCGLVDGIPRIVSTRCFCTLFHALAGNYRRLIDCSRAGNFCAHTCSKGRQCWRFKLIIKLQVNPILKHFARERHVADTRDIGVKSSIRRSSKRSKYTLQFIDTVPLLAEFLVNSTH